MKFVAIITGIMTGYQIPKNTQKQEYI